MADRFQSRNRNAFGGPDYNWDPRGYRYERENEQYRNRYRTMNRENQDWEYADYFGPEEQGNPSNRTFRNRSYNEENQPTWFYYEETWLVPGPYAGVGPRGYSRSDDNICESVSERLAAHGHLDASEIDVQVQDGEVILKGTVPDRQSKRLAEQIADSVYGVSDVRNELRINRQNQGQRQLGSSTRTGYGEETGSMMGQGMPGTSSSMGTRHMEKPRDLKEGQTVIGMQGKQLGTVKEIHRYDFVLNRPAAPDVHVPFSEIQDATGNQVRLNVSPDQIDKQGWMHI